MSDRPSLSHTMKLGVLGSVLGFSKKEKFLLLEVLPDTTTALFLSVDQEHALHVEDTRHDIGAKELQAYLKLHRAKQNIVVATDSTLVVTTVLPVRFDRAQKGAPLTAIELENILSKAIGQVFNQCRTEASRELGVDDLDTILVNSQVIQFKIDGHQVLDPTEFPAKTIEAVLELTLTTRGVFEQLQELLKAHKTFFFTERGRAELAMLRKVRHLPLTLIHLGAEHSTFFVQQKAAVGHRVQRADLIWHTVRFREMIADAFGVNHQTARDLYALYLADGLSPSATKHFERLLRPGIQALLAELKLAKFKGELFLSADIILPFDLPYKYGSLTLVHPPLAELLETLGMRVDMAEWGRTPGQVLLRLAPFLEFYYAKNNSRINEWLKRHLNWLGAPV